MTWFKVDDSFYDHLKVFDAPDCAVALWVRAGTWAARNLTDGFVPSGMPARLCDDPDTAVKELVRRKLWLRVKDGFRFHDWKKYQPTRESVEHDREQATERKRRERERRRGDKEQVKRPAVTDGSRRDSAGTTGVTHGTVTAPRPDPTRPGLPNGSLEPPAADAAEPQGALPGMPEPLPPPEREYTPEDMAFGVARWRIAEREQAKKPIVGGGKKGPVYALQAVLVDAFRAGYTEDEVRTSLEGLRDGIPSKQQLNRALAQIRDVEAGNSVVTYNAPHIGGSSTYSTPAPRRSTSTLRAEQGMAVADELDREYGHGQYAQKGPR